MNADLNRAKSIFLNAAEIASHAEQEAYLAAQCGDDEALRREVADLLAHHAPARAFLETPALNLGANIGELASEHPGKVIGRYKLLEQIGEGGMGAVWMAQQTEPVQRLVALKLIKPGMDSKQVLARFEAERQALALMDHTNIAKVFDAGTTPETRPYFVMELVKGVPITKYCDERCLTTRQRLELFVPVCQAIQHAHQKGIIHRDIKPSNVLVAMYDDKPVPKVIDFGVAKAIGQQLTDHTLHTGFGAVVGTVEYMSPEQAGFNQLDIDTRSDIYSLGVLLYELLAGSPPFSRTELEKAGLLEMLRVIREQEPSKPSTMLSSAGGLPTLAANRGTEPRRLTALVRGEIDWIVMKGLEKDRNRRYETATSFAADVQRYLNDETVQACPPSAVYQFRKFTRRHGRILATAGLIAMTLLTAAAVSTWQALRATEAKAEAEADRDRAKTAERQAITEQERAKTAERSAATEAAIARAVNDFLQGDLLGQVNRLPKEIGERGEIRNLTVKEALDRAAARIGERFRDQPLVEAAIRTAIGEAYKSIMQSHSSVPHLERAVALRQAHLGLNYSDTWASMNHLALAYGWICRHRDAIALRQQMFENREARFGPDHPETLACLADLAGAYNEAWQFDKSARILEQMLERRRTLLGPTDGATLGTMIQLARIYGNAGRFAESLALYQKAFDGLESTKGLQHESMIWPKMTFAQTCLRVGEFDRAEQLLREALAQIQQRETSWNSRKQRSNALGWLALTMHLRHRDAEAESLIRETLAFFGKEYPDNPRTFYWKSVLGAILLGQKKYPEAEAQLLQGYEGYKQRETTDLSEKNELIEAGQRVVGFYEATNQPEKVREWREKLKAQEQGAAFTGIK